MVEQGCATFEIYATLEALLGRPDTRLETLGQRARLGLDAINTARADGVTAFRVDEGRSPILQRRFVAGDRDPLRPPP
jgi:hypothetical protein